MSISTGIGAVPRALKLRLLFGTLGLFVTPLPCSSSAWAAPTVASDRLDAPSESAKALAAQGVKLYREGQYEAAQHAFSRSYELDPQTETLLELSLAELEAGRPVEASKHLRAYLGRSDAPAAKLDVVRTKWLQRAEARTARLDVFARAGAEIRVDGNPVQVEPSPASPGDTTRPLGTIVIAAGEHEVTAQDGALVQSQHVVARGGELIEVHFQRVPDAPSPSVASLGWAGPARAADRSGTTDSRAKWVTVIGLGSAAVVATGVAIGFSIAVEKDASDADALMQRVRTDTGGNSGCLAPTPATQCAQISRDHQAEHSNAALANGFYAGAGALALLGAASFFFWPSPKAPSATAVHPVPVFGDRFAGAALTGAW
jgi:tetratricopeptide (TPR) repeat protein